ncbi:cyclin-D5-1-like isoform X1 [Senna tora]|uniref:B-like cyclin n=1 Tax=Senna tora TaxID=362788 RepID=A0A834THD9_9FABA|nr:cyclin-D5-1-like isoform X1 [Senna tora]
MDESAASQENERWPEQEVVDEDSFLHLNDDSGPEDEYVDILMEREIAHGFKRDESLVFGNCLKIARLDAINWILKTRATLGFRFQTAYLCVMYLDGFLCRRSIDSEQFWAMRLLSVACLSLAAKMEECNVPPLSAFQLQDYSFHSKAIQRMELLVLSTLEWNLRFITPFPFLPSLIKNLCNKSPTTFQTIFTTLIKEINSMDHRPSVVAAAATLVALDQELTREAVQLKMSSVSGYRNRILETEEIYTCYNLIRRLYTENTRIDKFVHSPNPSPIQSRSESCSDTSAASAITKRRRLTFKDPKETPGPHDF